MAASASPVVCWLTKACSLAIEESLERLLDAALANAVLLDAVLGDAVLLVVILLDAVLLDGVLVDAALEGEMLVDGVLVDRVLVDAPLANVALADAVLLAVGLMVVEFGLPGNMPALDLGAGRRISAPSEFRITSISPWRWHQ
jgi:hypothetical protein